ncbi:MAG: 2,3,4,5-tetrahydropyridine-2,6-dicarboxylate N-succinyltransferase [Candidatus Kapabacteria bacterium]|jgi:2,3,4,5-tetrahydropyridine-2-carboxylate N-succinyltransferase|nr:2,3,4,5-tetrahydropyridine-2,6-dicarboxylate N-succinyltransferase [Candidatus Kapabacteria bacterium]
MHIEVLITQIEKVYEKQIELSQVQIDFMLERFLEALNTGIIRAAEKTEDGNWKVNMWVKKGILLIFRYSNMKNMSESGFAFYDKELLTLKKFTDGDGVRIVPGGSSIRTGSYLAKGVICMPPMYVNIGSYVDEGTMIDSHALVGTCAQIGKNVHISAAAQVGGVLEPAGARPVIIEDNVMIGGNCGVYEGVLIRERAVLGSGVVLNASTRVYDLVNETIIGSYDDNPLEIPANAVVVPGSRALKSDFAGRHGLSVSTPLIVKYRDDKTDAKTSLNFDLR